jgi:hypothetical protein
MASLTELVGFPPSATISPSVRLLETDFSAYVPGRSFSKAALVGFASKGPLNEPTQVFNHEELYRKFGYPDPTADHGSYLLYAAIEFLKYGNELWILRVGCTDETDWDNFAKTAYVEVPISGLAAVIRSKKNGSTEVEIVKDVNDNFRFSVNGSLYKKLITIPAGTYTLTDQGGSTPNLVDTFNNLLKNEDGIEAFEYPESNPTLAFRTNNRYGEDASIELISVEDDIYDTIGIGKKMTYSKITGKNYQWPIGSSIVGFDFSGHINPTLKVRVTGTGNPNIDNIVQVIPFNDLVHPFNTDPSGGAYVTVNRVGWDGSGSETGIGGPIVTAQNIVDFINWWIDNPTMHGENIPGGFRAKISTSDGKSFVQLYTGKYYTDSLGDPLVVPSDLVGGINYIRGVDALVQVQSYSHIVDEILGFNPSAVTGKTPVLVSTRELIDGDPDTATGNYIDDIGKSIGDEYNSGVAPTIFTIWADSPGLFGNDTKVVLDINQEGNISLFIYHNTVFVESHGNLNLDFTTTNNPYYIEEWINGVSDYIHIVHETNVLGAPKKGTYSLGQTSSTSGSDGYPYIGGLPDTEQIDKLILGNVELGTGLNALSEPEKIDIDLVAVPAINSTSVMSGLIELCSVARRDCMAIIDSPYGLDSVNVRKWHNGEHLLNNRKLNSSYAALYWPWVKIKDPFNSVEVWVPPTGSILGVYAGSERIANVWAAPAGLRRGRIPTVLEVETYAYLTQRDALYGSGNSVNVIVPFPVDGPTVWGQKTLQRASTALDRVNVRRLMLYLEKTFKDRSRYLLFEPHDSILRSQFVRIASTILDNVKEGRGIYNYIIKCDEELNPPEVVDRNEMRARIGIQPTKTAEFIFIEFTIHRTGSFEESNM